MKHKKRNYFLSLTLCMVLILGQIIPVGASYAQDGVTELSGGTESVVQDGGSEDKESDSAVGVSEDEGIDEAVNKEEIKEDEEIIEENAEKGSEEKGEASVEENTPADENTVGEKDKNGLPEESATTDGAIENQEDNEEPPEEVLKEMVSEPVMETLELAFENGLPNIKEYEATTQSAIYFIDDAAGMKKLGELVNGGVDFKEKTLKMTQDVDLELQEWTPVGTIKHPFCGVFDGGGCKVKNLKMDTLSLEYIGLFGYIKNAEIKNTEIDEGSTVKGTAEAKNIYAGGFAAYAEESKFADCRNAAEISILNLAVQGNQISTYTGGIAGYVKKSAFKNCSNKGIITSESAATKSFTHKGGLGGLAGFAEGGSFEGCANEGSISGGWKTEKRVKDYFSGGLLGYAKDVSLSGCKNSGEVTVVGSYVGGMIGKVEASDKKIVQLTNCENGGEIEIKGTKPMYAGGMLGRGMSVEMNGCKNMKSIKGEWYVGGLAGYLEGKNSCIHSSINEGNISSLTEIAGGIVGYANEIQIVQCGNSGMVSASQQGGGIVGYSSVCELSDSYNTGDIIASTKEAGGILGYWNCTTVSNCYNLGKVESLVKKGGISTASDSQYIKNCYFLEGCVESPEDASVAISKPEVAFSDGEVASLLNTLKADEEEAFSGIWGQGEKYPVFADEDILAVGRITLKVKDEAGEEKGGAVCFGSGTEAKTHLVEKSLTLTVTPEDGYILRLLNLTDTDGSKIAKSREDQEDGTIVFTFQNQGKNVIAEAIFEKKADDAPENINITWNLDGGTVTEGETPTTVKYGAALSEPVIEREEYFFGGWYAGENPDTEKVLPYDFETALTADLILTAVWNEDALYISFDLCDGTQPEEAQRFPFEGKFTPKEVSHTPSPGMEYKLLGWYTEKDGKGEKWEKDRKIDRRGKLTLYAAWELIDSFENGTRKEPCIIADADTLAALAVKINNGSAHYGYETKYFKLGSDIDLKEIEQWIPIGTEEYPFRGTFDGAYHTVSNLKIDARELDNQGLFGYVEGNSVISNLYLENSSVRGKNNVGAVIGQAKGKVASSVYHLGVKGGSITAEKNAGGVIGSVMEKSVTDVGAAYSSCFNTAEVTASAGNAGGIAGGIYTKDMLSRCYNTGKVSGNSAGALAGAGYERNQECYYLASRVENPVDGAAAESKPSAFFERGEGAYALDQGEAYTRTTDWSQGEDFPVFADGENGPVFRISLKQGENGSASIEGMDENGVVYANSGTKPIVKVQAEEGWFLKQLSVTEVRSGDAVKAEGAGSETKEAIFIMPEADVYVVPVFAQRGEGTVKVTYDLDGGNWADVPDPSGSVPFGTVVAHPSVNPQKTGFTFRGWYAGNEKYLFTEAVTEDLVLKAKWCTNGKFLVTFNLNREGWAEEELPKAFWDKEVEKDGKIEYPGENPQWVYKDQYTAYKFAGWYTEPVGGKAWDFGSDTVTQDVILYAHWSEVDALSAGTKEHPCPIASVEELQYLAERVNAGNTYAKCYFQLTSDLDLRSIASWTPIGTHGVPFSGYFDGNKKTIQNLKIQGRRDYAGLFGEVKEGEIKDLTLDDVQIVGGKYTGAIVGSLSATATFSGLTVRGDISGTNQVGGIVGSAGEDTSARGDKKTFSGLYFDGSVEGSNQVGGIAGIVYGRTLENASVRGTVKGTDYIGGIIGRAAHYKVTQWGYDYGCTFLSCSNFADVSGNHYVGGLAGYAEMRDLAGTANKSCNEGAVLGDDFVGGLFGALEAVLGQSDKEVVSVCYNTGRIKATAPEASGAGGLVGVQKSKSTYLAKITDSFNAGIIEGSSSSNVGAICGVGYEQNENCYHLLSECSFADAAYSKAMKQENFESGYAAYLMDGGMQTHANLWGQGAEHPVFADKAHSSVYEIELTVNGEGSAVGADLQKGLNYKAIENESIFKVTPEESSIIALFEVVNAKGEVLYSGSGKDALQYKLPSGTSMSINVSFAKKSNEAFTVTFDLRGGKINEEEVVKRMEVPFGTKASELKPSQNPVKKIEGAEGEYAFSGWYADETLSQAFNFDTLITDDVTIYAKYKEKTTIRFDLNGPKTAEEASKVPAEQKLVVGDHVVRPENPTWNKTEEKGITETHAFLGWSTDSERWLEWDFTKRLQAEDEGKIITLYAHWKITYAITDEMLEEITDEGLFKKLAENVKNGERYIGKTLSLGDDITLNGWTRSIGSSSTPFEGIFDGSGHTITVEGGTTPLFGYIGFSGSLKNVTVSGTMQAKDSNTFGGLVNTNRGIIQNCHAKDLTVDGKDAEAVGGIVGQTIGYLQDCTTDSKSRISGKKNVGGIAGNINMTSSSIKNCENAAEVTSTADTAGGIAGTDEGNISGRRSQVEECRNTGKIEGALYAGGILGAMTKPLTLESCKNEGNILSGAGSAGGILGIFSDVSTSSCVERSEVLSCENSGDISGKKSVGGIAGKVDNNMWLWIDGCKNSGVVTADGAAAAAGGIMGTITRMASLSKCENSGAVSSTGRFTGGIIGSVASLSTGETAGTISLCSSTGDVSCSGDGGVAGGVAGEGYRVENAYSTGKVSGASSFGICKAMQAGTEYVTTIENCYWYNKDSKVNGLCGGGTIKNSYYYSPEIMGSRMFSLLGSIGEEDAVPSARGASSLSSSETSEPMAQPEKAFTGGKIAYLLDGGEEKHNEIWTQGSHYPELGKPSCYKITLGENLSVGGESTAYANAGSNVNVTISLPLSSDPKMEYKLTSLKAKQAGSTSDITALKSFTLGDGNADVAAAFALVAKEEKPVEENPSKPSHKPGSGGSGNGTGNGNGNGNDDFGKEGEGGGTGTGIGTGTDSGDHDGYHNTGEKTTTKEPNYVASQNQDVKSESVQMAEQADQNQMKKEEASLEASGGATEGGSGGDEEKEKEALTVFEIVKKTAQENPLLVALLALMMLAILFLAAAARYRRYRKDQ